MVADDSRPDAPGGGTPPAGTLLPWQDAAFPAPAGPPCDCGTDVPCCGPPAGPRSTEDEICGYEICHFAEGFLETPAGRVPRLRTRLSSKDLATAVKARWGIDRDAHRVAPGLYATGEPGPESPVVATANYKLSLAQVRRGLAGRDAWVLVLDTRGINVWCAAGKGTFSTEEAAWQIGRSGLTKVVDHRRIILPQLGATGISARELRRRTGFSASWGPVRARDLGAFLDNGLHADESMRRVTFGAWERAVLIPVELVQLAKPCLLVLLALFAISGIGPGIYSVGAAWSRGIMLATACVLGVFSGCIATPLLLPMVPATAFSVKGALTGVFAGGASGLVFAGTASKPELLAMVLFATAVSSYVAMNYTGATPYTSPSGVEYEMRRAMPVQAAAVLLALGIWCAAPFFG